MILINFKAGSTVDPVLFIYNFRSSMTVHTLYILIREETNMKEI